MEKDKLNEHIDSILNILNTDSGWELERLYENITGKDYCETYDDFVKIEAILKSENIAELRPSGMFFITPKGIDIVNSGGYLKYKDSIALKQQLQHRKELLEVDQLQWNKKTRKQTMWISLIALLISIISIIMNIIDKIDK